MIEVNNVEVFNFEAAVRGLRNPYDSWSKSDSGYDDIGDFIIGYADLSLMHKLFKAGTEHRKFMRQMIVSMDITAPLYWWKQFDTYKIGTTANSQSTMHTIAKYGFNIVDFSFDKNDGSQIDDRDAKKIFTIESMLTFLNGARELYLETKDKDDWRFLIQLLPESYNQTRTVTMNYEVAATIIRQREHHKLHEWDAFIKELRKLPYLDNIMDDADGE